MGWIGMSMVGFEQRTQYNEYLGQFDMGENGWLLSWARETAGTYGVFRYGFTYKMVTQQFSGLQNGSAGWSDGSREHGDGLVRRTGCRIHVQTDSCAGLPCRSS